MNGFDSFAEYAEYQYDDLWDEYLDWLGITGLSVDIDSVDEWLAAKAARGEISAHAAKLMRDYVARGETEK